MAISGSVSHSACQLPSARSCSCTIDASMVDTSAGTRVTHARTAEQATGLRLCGIVDDPPRPGASGSASSAISVCACKAMSRAIFPSVPASRPRVVAISAKRSRCVCQGSAGKSSDKSLASAVATVRPRSPRLASVPVAPPSCSTHKRSRNVCRRS